MDRSLLAHAQTLDGVALVESPTLVVSDILHAHLVDALNLSIPDDMPAVGIVLKAPAERRTLIVAPERRILKARIH